MFKFMIATFSVFSLTACAVSLSNHPLEPARIGQSISEADFGAIIRNGKQIGFEKVTVATWTFPVRFCAPAPEDCSLQERELDAEVYIYLLTHPEYGTFLIDAGFPENHEADYGKFLRAGLGKEGEGRLAVSQNLGKVLAARGHPDIQGVFVTHLHFDHVQGVRDLPDIIPIYTGPNAGRERHIYFRFIAKPLRDALAGRAPLQVLPFKDTQDIVDVFGDGSLMAIHVPGHTPGSTAYLVNATDGRHLITGDAVMDIASWHGPEREAQTFKRNFETSWQSRERLHVLAGRVSGLTIHPGHDAHE